MKESLACYTDIKVLYRAACRSRNRIQGLISEMRRLVGLVQAWSRLTYQTEVRPFYELLVSNVVGCTLIISKRRCLQSRIYICFLALLKCIMNDTQTRERACVPSTRPPFLFDDSLKNYASVMRHCVELKYLLSRFHVKVILQYYISCAVQEQLVIDRKGKRKKKKISFIIDSFLTSARVITISETER